MIVAGVQTGHMRGASARIRYFTFMKHLKCEKTTDFEKADVVYFQKKSSKDIIKLAKVLKKNGKKIVFDCDDGDGDRNRVDRNDPAMFKVADAITTDTEERAKRFRKRTDTPVYVVQDCIDYGIKREDRVELTREIIKVGTFGTHKVLEATVKKMKQISYTGFYITDRKIKAYEKIGWKFVEWKLDTFVNNLRLFDLCILSHPENETGKLKSNNRLLVCMALGIPVIVSRTQGYLKTLKEAAIDYVVAMNYEMRKKISNKLYKFVWDSYSPEKSAEQLEQVFRRVYDSGF